MKIEPTVKEIVLKKNGKPCICPFQTKIAIPVPHHLNPNQVQIQIQEFQCTSKCQFFNYLPKRVYNPYVNYKPDDDRRDNKVLLECTKSTYMVDDDVNII